MRFIKQFIYLIRFFVSDITYLVSDKKFRQYVDSDVNRALKWSNMNNRGGGI